MITSICGIVGKTERHGLTLEAGISYNLQVISITRNINFVLL